MLKKRTLSLSISLFFSFLFASVLFAAGVETVGDLKVSGMIDNLGGDGVKFPDGSIQESACTACAGGILSISLGGTGASNATTALSNLGGVNKTGDTMTGNLSVPSVFLSGNLTLPTTSPTAGIIKVGAENLMHSFGTNSFFAGRNAGNTNLTGGWNTGVGHAVLGVNTSGGFNSGIGSLALMNNSTGTGNTAVGYSALYSNTTGGGNTAIGNGSLNDNVEGTWNTAVGYNTLGDSTGYGNTAVGFASLQRNSTGSYNTATGRVALGSNLGGGLNAAFGDAALYGNSSGSYNTAIGYSAGYTGTSGANANTTGSNNTFIGYFSGPGTATQLTNATAIGANALVSASNSLVLGAPGVKVGIGTQTPAESLDVVGNLKVSGTISGSMAANSINTAAIANGSVTSTKLANNAVTTATLANGAVTSTKIYVDQDFSLNMNDLKLLYGDTLHGLGWYGAGKSFVTNDNIDGPVLYGFHGGALGTTNDVKRTALSWDSNGNVTVPTKLSAGPGLTGTPIAHGVFYADGNKASGSANLSCTWDSGNSWYECPISGVSYDFSTHVTNVTAVGAYSPVISTTSSTAGHLIVSLFNISGSRIQHIFGVTVYKP